MMRRLRTMLVLAAGALMLAACGGLPSRTAGDALRGASTARQILVTVRSETAPAAGLAGAPSGRYLNRRYGAAPGVERTLDRLARDHGLARVTGWEIESLAVYCEVFEIPPGESLDEVIATVRADPRVDLVQRMNLFRTELTRYDDPYVDLQSAAAELELEDAHRFATGRDVLVAIVDSAVDAAHPDLRGSVRLARNLVGARAVPRGGEVHGTAVAGVIASAVNNREGIIGVAPDARLAALRACWPVTAGSPESQCSSFSLAQALDVAFRLAPKVLNMSLAGPEDELLSRLLDRLIERGTVVVAAEARAPGEARFPASHPGALVAHSSADPPDATLASKGFGAPGHEVLTTLPGARYAFLSGNSLAAAHTTGVIALLLERAPDLTAERIAVLLAESAASGSINACRALDRLNGTRECRHPVEVASGL